MELGSEDGSAGVVDSLVGFIISVNKEWLPSVREGFGVYCKAVVLGCNKGLLSQEVYYWLIVSSEMI